jgi:hypothetical protein
VSLLQHPAFAGAPDKGKVALDGAWEQALTFRPGELIREAEVPPMVAAATDVACEAFFGDAFFGLRHVGPDARRFVVTFGQALAGPDFFAALTHLPLAQDLQYAEIGAEGAWRSVGPYRLDSLDPDGVWVGLQSTAVARDTVHDKALEFSFGNGDGTTHWFALPVSRAGHLDRDLLEQALVGWR